MNNMGLLGGALLLGAISMSSIAETTPFFEAKIPKGSARTLNAGFGFTEKMVHVNGEYVVPYGIAYGKVGAFLNGDNTAGAQIGFRYPYFLTGKDKNGYYIGAFAGHIDSKPVNSGFESRLGAGVDLAYVWLNPERISTASIGLVAGEKLTSSNGDVAAKTEPRLQFSYSLSFGLPSKK